MKHIIIFITAFSYLSCINFGYASIENTQKTVRQKNISKPLNFCHCARGPRGPRGFRGRPGTFSASYGQLSLSSQSMIFESANNWLSIPFDSTGLTSNMSVSTTSPATIAVEQAGIYQINVSVYFSVEDSAEDTFNITTYTLGLNVNGVTTPVSAVYVGEPGYFSLNYSNIMEFSVNDYIQFYIEASIAEGPPFANNVTLENGNAYVMHISN